MKLITLAALYFISTACNSQSKVNDIFSAYENIKKPAIFAPELALKGNTYKGSFSADYASFYFFRQITPNQEDFRIYESRFTENKWSEPRQLSFSDTSSDLYPVISPLNPNKLYFASYRRTPSDTSKKTKANIWFSVKNKNNWEKPKPLTEADLIYNYNSQPCFTKKGNIYFSSQSPDWSKKFTYKMRFKDGMYQKPELFDFVQQLRLTDTTKIYWEICVAPDESYLILTISEKGKEETKLYLSKKDRQLTWTPPQYIGELIKEDMSGNFPYITMDGKFLIFTKAFSSFWILPTKTFISTD